MIRGETIINHKAGIVSTRIQGFDKEVHQLQAPNQSLYQADCNVTTNRVYRISPKFKSHRMGEKMETGKVM